MIDINFICGHLKSRRRQYWLRLGPRSLRYFFPGSGSTSTPDVRHRFRSVLDFVHVQLFMYSYLNVYSLFVEMFLCTLIHSTVPFKNLSVVFKNTFLHCPKSNQNFRDITWNVVENMILHEIFRVLSHFSPLHFMLSRGKLISFGTVWLCVLAATDSRIPCPRSCWLSGHKFVANIFEKLKQIVKLN